MKYYIGFFHCLHSYWSYFLHIFDSYPLFYINLFLIIVENFHSEHESDGSGIRTFRLVLVIDQKTEDVWWWFISYFWIIKLILMCIIIVLINCLFTYLKLFFQIHIFSACDMDSNVWIWKNRKNKWNSIHLFNSYLNFFT